MKKLKTALMEQARAKGICVDGYIRMTNSTKEELIDFYIESPDWCMERDYPTLDFLREHFSGIEDRGVFVGKDFHGELLNDRQAYIFHNCSGKIKVGLNVDKALIPMLYLANKCRMRIVGVGDFKPKRLSERTEVPVYMFGENCVSAKDNMFVTFNKYQNPLL